MSFTAIVAVTPDNGIGAGGKLLAPNPVDLAFFCGYTLGKVVVVGRKTAESFGSELKGRDVVCMSRQDKDVVLNSTHVDWVWDGGSIHDLITYADGRDIVVCGGAEVYKHFESLYDSIIITELSQECLEKPDAWFDVDLTGYTATNIMKNTRYEMRVVRYDRNR